MSGIIDWQLWEVVGVSKIEKIETYGSVNYTDAQAMASLYVERQPKSKAFYVVLWDGEKHHLHILLQGEL